MGRCRWPQALTDVPAIFGAVILFLVFTLPVAILGVWDKFSDEKVPIWLAKRGYPSVMKIFIAWVAISLVLSVAIYFIFYAISSRTLRNTINIPQEDPLAKKVESDPKPAVEPDMEFTNPLLVDRWIHPELGLVDEKPVPDFPFGSSESLEVQVMLARFYYKPDPGVPETIHVKAHIAIADAGGNPIHARYDAVWDQETRSEYQTFDTAETHGLIIALVFADADPKSIGTFEYRERSGEFDPDCHRFEGAEFRLRLELIGKQYDQRVLYKAFDFGLGLAPKPWMKLI